MSAVHKSTSPRQVVPIVHNVPCSIQNLNFRVWGSSETMNISILWMIGRWAAAHPKELALYLPPDASSAPSIVMR